MRYHLFPNLFEKSIKIKKRKSPLYDRKLATVIHCIVSRFESKNFSTVFLYLATILRVKIKLVTLCLASLKTWGEKRVSVAVQLKTKECYTETTE